MKVLVVEDDPDQLFVRGLLLRQNGFEVIEASNPFSALTAAADGKPQCAVIDIRLPSEELGLELIEDLKALDPAIHIFVLTGGDPSRLWGRLGKKLVDALLVKGASSAELIRKLKALA